MRKFLSSNILWGIVLSLFFFFMYNTENGAFEKTGLRFYDLCARFTPPLRPSAAGKIAIIDINDDSISEIGRWPWQNK